MYLRTELNLTFPYPPKDWFKDARTTLDTYQKSLLQREQESWQEDRSQYITELAEELKLLKEEESKSPKDLLQFVYKTHPPKWRKDKKVSRARPPLYK